MSSASGLEQFRQEDAQPPDAGLRRALRCAITQRTPSTAVQNPKAFSWAPPYDRQCT
ncbi:Unknown protein sequence [Pseudomonas amygdali pv. lachrymans]|uniref:Uncharacterized protein n=1 Tax=Pseudomonas amygdali pv. lachrymans TaxID=53707 RepID=A0ABR5KL23_PSEAV|nr:Unknown protein sequence [Pseudomonas amygdali pv. lachrymans]